MQINTINKVKGLINISNKAGYLIVGADALKKHNKKLYLIIRSDSSGKGIIKITENLKQKTNCEEIVLNENDIQNIVCIDNCKIVGIKNLGLSKEIIKYIRGE